MSFSVTNPFASGGSGLGGSGMGLNLNLQGLKPKKPEEEQMYGMANPFKGKSFEGFQVPESNGVHNSFRPNGPLGDNAIQATNGAELGRNLFHLA
jgi:hypothetical protein